MMNNPNITPVSAVLQSAGFLVFVCYGELGCGIDYRVEFRASDANGTYLCMDLLSDSPPFQDKRRTLFERATGVILNPPKQIQRIVSIRVHPSQLSSRPWISVPGWMVVPYYALSKPRSDGAS